MKKLILSAAIVASFGIATSTFAADTPPPTTGGTITFNGQVGSQTCNVHGGGDSGAADFTVLLDKVQAGALGAAGQYAGTKPFQLVVDGDEGDPNSGCANGTQLHITYEANNTGFTPEGYLPNKATTDAATNVAVQLLNSAGAPMNLQANNNSETQTVAGNKATFNFYAQYVSQGAATAGAVSAAVQYSLAYD